MRHIPELELLSRIQISFLDIWELRTIEGSFPAGGMVQMNDTCLNTPHVDLSTSYLPFPQALPFLPLCQANVILFDQ